MGDFKGKKKVSPKDQKHRRIKNVGVDGLKEYFQIVTGIELPKGAWDQLIKLVWSKIFEAGKVEKQERALMELEEYAAKAGQEVKSTRTAVEKAKIQSNELEYLMQPLQQYLLNQDYSQHLDCSEVVSAPPDSIQNETNAELQKLVGPSVNMEFSALEDVKVPNQYSAENQISSSSSKQPDPNNEPEEIKPMTWTGGYWMRKTQGQIALKVFFYMYTGIVLPKNKLWGNANELIERKCNDAKNEGEKLKAVIGHPESAAKVEQTVLSLRPAFEELERQNDYCLQLWNDLVLGDLPNPPESEQMLESWKATGCSSGTSTHVAPKLDCQGSPKLGDNERFLLEIIKVFPEIAEGKGDFINLLLEMAKNVPQRPELKDSNNELESLDLRASLLKEKVDKICQEQALGKKKSKLKRKQSG